MNHHQEKINPPPPMSNQTLKSNEVAPFQQWPAPSVEELKQIAAIQSLMVKSLFEVQDSFNIARWVLFYTQQPTPTEQDFDPEYIPPNLCDDINAEVSKRKMECIMLAHRLSKWTPENIAQWHLEIVAYLETSNANLKADNQGIFKLYNDAKEQLSTLTQQRQQFINALREVKVNPVDAYDIATTTLKEMGEL